MLFKEKIKINKKDYNYYNKLLLLDFSKINDKNLEKLGAKRNDLINIKGGVKYERI